MVTTAKNTERVSRMLKRSGEPSINPLDYTATLVRALNWYNIEVDGKTKRGWFLARFKKEIKESGVSLSDVHDREFRTVGALVRIQDNGNALSDKDSVTIQSEFTRICTLATQLKLAEKPVTEVDVPIVPRQTAQEKLEDQAADFMAEFNNMVDEFTVDRTQMPDVSRVMKFRPSPNVAKLVAAKLPRMIQELTDTLAGADKQLTEGYSNFKRTELKRLLGVYQELAAELVQTKKVVVTKPRAAKPVPVVKLIAKVKFQKEFPELGLKSVLASGLIGATEVWCYNTKYKTLAKYVSMDGMTITVKGTTLMNVDQTNSVQRSLRKPEYLSAEVAKGKRAMSQYISSLTTKSSVPNGRINENTIILAAYK